MRNRSEPTTASTIERLEQRQLLSGSGQLALGGTGLTGEYFQGSNFTEALLTRTDKKISFSWGADKPDPTFGVGFSAEWTGSLLAPATGTYTFSTFSDSGTRLVINGATLIDNLASTTRGSSSGSIPLQAGQLVTLSMSFVSPTAGPAPLKLLWNGPGTGGTAVVPKGVLFPTATPPVIPGNHGLLGTYYFGDKYAAGTEALQRIDPTIDKNWPGPVTPDHVIPSYTPYSVVWTGQIEPQYSETYTFYTRSDDGVTLTINGQEIINDPHQHLATSHEGKIALQAGVKYDITMTYFQNHIAPANVKLHWSSASQPKEIVPFGDLYSVAAPAAPTLTAAPNLTAINLAWNDVAGETGFILERSTDGTNFTTLATLGQGVLAYTDSDVSGSTTYSYRVTAVDGIIDSDPSNVVSATTGVPAPLAASAVASGDTSATVSWTGVSGATQYRILKSTSPTGPFTTAGTVDNSSSAFTATGLTPATTYYFEVETLEGSMVSGPSNVASATTTAAVPSFASETTIYGLTTSTAQVYSINTGTGAATAIGTLAFGTSAAGRDPLNGNFYYTSTGTTMINLAEWNPTTGGNSIVISNVPVTGNVLRAAFRSDGAFFVTAGNGDLLQFNVTTGASTAKGTITVNGTDLQTDTGDMAFAPDGTLYIATNGMLYSIPASTVANSLGASSSIPATAVGSLGIGDPQLAFGQNGVLYAMDPTGQLNTINLSTGQASPIGTSTGITFGDLASVPLYADLAVTQTASTLTRSVNGSYTLTVTNNGPNATNAPTTLVDTLPTGLSFVSGSGAGWSFSASGSTVTMTYTGDLAAGASAPAVTLTVGVATSTPNSVTNTATVSTTIFDGNTSDNSSSLTSPVVG